MGRAITGPRDVKLLETIRKCMKELKELATEDTTNNNAGYNCDKCRSVKVTRILNPSRHQ
jgi:hypothetical protein